MLCTCVGVNLIGCRIEFCVSSINMMKYMKSDDKAVILTEGLLVY